MAETLNRLKIAPWWIRSSKLLANGGLCCFPMLEQPHRLAEESPILFLPRRSHLPSCRWVFSWLWAVRSEPAMTMLPLGLCYGQKLCFLPSVHLSRSIYLRTEQLKSSWNDMLGFRLFWAGNRRLLGPGWPYNLWVPRSHSSEGVCKPWLKRRQNFNVCNVWEKNPIFLSFSMNCFFFYFLTGQRALLFSLQWAILQGCVAALPTSPQGCMML